MKKHLIISFTIMLVFVTVIGLSLNRSIAQTATTTNNSGLTCRNFTSNFYYQMDAMYNNLYNWASGNRSTENMRIYSEAVSKYRSDVANLHRILQAEGFTVSQQEVTARDLGFSTASAISGLQEKYRAQILTPRGLNHGTGIMDPETRAFLNQKYGCIQRASIDLINPFNNVVRGRGENVMIRWNATRIPNTTTLNIEYVRIDANGSSTSATSTILTRTISNGSGTFDWTIPQNIPVGRYRIQAFLSGSASSDVSRAVIEVRDNTIEVTSPSGERTISVGERVSVNWRTGTAVKPENNVNIQLVNESSTTSAPIILNIATVRNSGSYTWVVPQRIGTTNIANGSRYRILVSSGNGFSGYSSGSFTISNVVVNRPTITITSTNPVTVQRGGNVELRWSSLNIGNAGRMSIQLIPTGNVGATTTLATNVSVLSGSRNLEIPGNTVPGSYRLRIVSSGVEDASPSVLLSPVITVSQQSVSLSINISGVTSVPKAGSIPVRWTGSGISSSTNVAIELINESGTTVSGTRITRNFASGVGSGSVNLNIPANIPNGNYKVRISVNADSRTITSESSNVSIASASIAIATTTVPTISVSNTRGSSTEMTARFSLRLSATGGTIDKPTTGNLNPASSNFRVVFVGPNGVEIPATSYTVTMNPNSAISAGRTGTATVVAKVRRSDVSVGGAYTAYLQSYELSLDRAEMNRNFTRNDFSTPTSVNFIR